MRFEIKPLPDDGPEGEEKKEEEQKPEPEKGSGSGFLRLFVISFIVAAVVSEVLYLLGFNWVEFIYLIFNRHPC